MDKVFHLLVYKCRCHAAHSIQSESNLVFGRVVKIKNQTNQGKDYFRLLFLAGLLLNMICPLQTGAIHHLFDFTYYLFRHDHNIITFIIIIFILIYLVSLSGWLNSSFIQLKFWHPPAILPRSLGGWALWNIPGPFRR